MKKKVVWLFGCVLCLVFLGWGYSNFGPMAFASSLTESSSVIAFVDVNVVPMDSERILEGQTVLVRGSLIEKMGPVSEIQVPEGAMVIEGNGGYLMPGLADMHFHNENENDFILCLANGVTFIRNMWGDTKHLEWRRRIESGELLGPTLITSGPLLDGPPPIWEGSAVIETVEQARKAVSDQKKAGYDFIKIYDQLSLEVFDAIMDEARKQAIPVAGHIPFSVGVQHALKSGLVSNEHLTGYMDQIQMDDFPGKGKDDLVSRLRSWMYLDEAKIPSVVAAARDSTIWDCVTLVVYQGLMSPSESYEYLKRPELKYLGPLTGAFWDPKNDPRWDELNEKDFEQRRRMDLILKKLTGALYKENGRILLGTDCQNGMVMPGFSIHRELLNLIEAGLTPYEAIKAGTSDAAAFFGVDTFGTVTLGKRADLVLLAGNPLEDVSHAKNIAGVMVRGQWLPQTRLQQMLDDLAASFVPPQDRFAEIPLLSSEEEIAFTGRFEMFYADVPMGEERFMIEKLPDGKNRLQAQAVTDSPYGSTAILNMIFDDSGGCYSLEFSHETSTGKKQTEMSRTEQKLKISGNIKVEEDVDLEEDVPENLYLGASMLSNIMPVLYMVKSLEVGEETRLKGKAVRVLPFWFISSVLNETITLARAADLDMSPDEKITPVRVYEMQVASESFPHSAKIFVNEKGELHELHLRNQQGLFKYVRLDQ